jgi:hypothetical protein
MRHADIQMNIVKPVDPTLPNSGVLTIFDRNLNSNTVLGMDFIAPFERVDRGGRPNFFDRVSIDVNESSGVYDEAYSQGVIKIRYMPDTRHLPGIFGQGKVIVKIEAQIYTTGVDFLLANSNINP